MSLTPSVMCSSMGMRRPFWSLTRSSSVWWTWAVRTSSWLLLSPTCSRWWVHSVYIQPGSHCLNLSALSDCSLVLFFSVRLMEYIWSGDELLFSQIFRLIRDTVGRRNLAAKTLVDKRFLIWWFTHCAVTSMLSALNALRQHARILWPNLQ